MEATLNRSQAGEGGGRGATSQTLGSVETETHDAPVARGSGAAPSTLRLGGLRGGSLKRQDDETTNATDSSVQPNTSATAPPYWQNVPSRRRAASTQSSDSGRPTGAILLLDNEADECEDRNNACWAKNVEIVDHTVVNGGATSIGAFVVWNVRVETLQVRGDAVQRAVPNPECRGAAVLTSNSRGAI